MSRESEPEVSRHRPSPTGADQAVRLDVAAAVLPGAVPVAETQPLGLLARQGDEREVVRLDRWLSRDQGHGRDGEGLHPPAQPRRQDLVDGGRDRGILVQQQRRQPGAARAERVAAPPAGDRVHRAAQFPEPVNVAPDRARGDAQPGGQLVAAPAWPGRQQRQQAEQPPGGIGHPPIMPCLCGPILSWILSRVST
jgi:hypothetical protein